MNIRDWRLTEVERAALLRTDPDSILEPNSYSLRVADAALAKALWGMVGWLERFRGTARRASSVEEDLRFELEQARVFRLCCPVCGGPVEGEPGHEGCVWGCWREQTSEVRDE